MFFGKPYTTPVIINNEVGAKILQFVAVIYGYIKVADVSAQTPESSVARWRAWQLMSTLSRYSQIAAEAELDQMLGSAIVKDAKAAQRRALKDKRLLAKLAKTEQDFLDLVKNFQNSTGLPEPEMETGKAVAPKPKKAPAKKAPAAKLE